MRIDFVKRYSLIVQLLRQKSSTFKEIKYYIEKRSDEEDYKIRTLQRDIKEIEIIFGTIIKNRMGRDARYYIEETLFDEMLHDIKLLEKKYGIKLKYKLDK